MAFALSALFLTSCGVKKNNIVAKKYHSTTTFFNYYYNGELKWQEGVDQINAAYRIPAEGYVEVMYSGNEDDSKTFADNFEQAIEKAEIALQKHDQKENNWLDNCRFLIGRSWYYKRNYLLAIKNFEHVIKTWPDSKIIPDVYLWLVKTHYMDGNNTAALKLLNEDMKKFALSKEQKGERALIEAQVLLDEGDYEQVVRVINRNKKNIKGRNNKARTQYLMGQIYADQGSYAKAFEAFRKVTKTNTDYELIFNAKINIAKLQIEQEGGNDGNKKLKRYLKKMLRDEKNIDYKDRIYYEMAMLYIKENNRPEAITQLKLSIQTNTDNQRQKALSYYKVGQIYFYDLQDFTMAEAYFDSASQVITRDAPEYFEISNISRTLKEYIGYVNTISTQDSLLKLAALSDQALERRVDQILKAKKEREEEEAEARLEELNRLNDPNLFNPLAGSQGGGRRGSSGFYFDNPELVSSGKIEFQQKWGQRKNEDHWRRRNKETIIPQDEIAAVADSVSPEDLEKYGSAEKARMIKDVPRTDEEISAAKGKVAEALYGLGQVYENKLNILDSAIETYLKLVRKYPEDEYALKGRYALYRIYKDRLEDNNKASIYEDEICSKYPESRYCRIIKTGIVEDDPDQENEDFLSAYNALYATYNSKDYETCINFANFIVSQHPTSDALAEVLYIKGKAFGYLGQKDSLKTIYEYVKLNFPEADVTPEVTRTLVFLSGNKPAPETTGGNTSTNPFPDNSNTGGPNPAVDNDPRYKGFSDVRRPNEKVYVVMLVGKDKLKSTELQQKINDYNRSNYQEARLNVSIFLYKNQFHLPYISQFKDEQEALSYIGQMMKEPGIGDLFTTETEKMVFITPQNFRTAYGKKRFEDYFLYYSNVVLKSLNGK